MIHTKLNMASSLMKINWLVYIPILGERCTFFLKLHKISRNEVTERNFH
jgi:hypothetical protein